MKQERAIVLVSGGMDSCVAAAIANERYKLAFLHINYGQRTESRELRAFKDISDFYNIEKQLVVNIEHLKVIGGSALTDTSISIPDVRKQSSVFNTQTSDLRPSSIPSTYVPFRNAHMLSIAVSWAEVIDATKIFIGAVEEDSSGYPDCRETFYLAFNKVIELGTKPETRIEIATPLIHMKKSEIIAKGVQLNAPLHLTWSCYKNNEKACGKCESCGLRIKGFNEAGIQDPIPYAV